MNIREMSRHQGVRWTALVALLVGVSQFNTGIKLFYSKWTADEAAAEAKKVAVEAKGTAEGVDERFDQYIEQQKHAIETQNKIAEAIQGYAAQQQHQAPNQAATPEVWWAQDEDGAWYCTDGRESWWPHQEGTCD